MNEITKKLTYNSPLIEKILLDNEISLVLMSGDSDPGEPGAALIIPEYFNNDPFKSNIV